MLPSEEGEESQQDSIASMLVRDASSNKLIELQLTSNRDTELIVRPSFCAAACIISSAVAAQDLQSCSSSSVGLGCAAAPEVALEQNTIGLIVFHACYVESVKAKHNVSQLLYDFLGQLHVLLSIIL